MLGKNGGTLNQKYEKAREMEYIEHASFVEIYGL